MKIRRHSAIELAEHWTIALSGILLLFTGIGELPLYKRYYFILDIPGLAWAGNYFIHLKLHYLFATFFTAAVVFHLLYHGILKERSLWPKKGDIGRSIHVLLATIGIGKEPQADKYLPEQRIAYLGIGLVVVVLILTGMFKIVKNVPHLYVPPVLNGVNTLVHTMAGFLFLLALVVHLAAFLIPSNLPVLKSMFTGKIDLSYIRKRHGQWYRQLRDEGVVPAEVDPVPRERESLSS
jgi:formate dehydrogenase subunit gamma